METMAESWGGVAEASDASRGQWFREAKFAMFIHWGLYSHLAGVWRGRAYYGNGEWIMHQARIPVAEYERVADVFNPKAFDARQWVQLAVDAGMRYIVITAKHHDGFAMFKSTASRFNIVDATPFGRDPLAELAQACAEAGIKLGFYYSQYQDWHERDAAGNDWDFDPKQRNFDHYLQTKALPQVRELLTNYGPVALIWFDTPGSISKDASQQLYDLVREVQPDCLVNSRIGNGLGDYSTLGDGELPLVVRDGLWETIDTHNDTWGYVEHDANWKGPRELVRRLVSVVSKGGNYMLNVGPTGLGEIPPMAASILRDVGAWVRPRAKAIYGAQPWAGSPLGWGQVTAQPGRLYAHVFDKPTSGRLWLSGIGGAVERAAALTDAGDVPVEVHRAGDAAALIVPRDDAPVTTIALDIPDAQPRLDPLPVASGGCTRLEAPYAQLEGCRLAKRRWIERFGEWHYADAVTGWTEQSSAVWTVRVFETGRFYLGADYACPLEGDGADFDVTVAGQRLLMPAIDTGDRPTGNWKTIRARFRPLRVGVVNLDPGTHRVEVRARTTREPDTFWLQRLTLTPMT